MPYHPCLCSCRCHAMLPPQWRSKDGACCFGHSTTKRGNRRDAPPLMISRSSVWHFCPPGDYPPVVLAVPGRKRPSPQSAYFSHPLPPLLFAQPSRSWPMFAIHLLQLYPTLSSCPLSSLPFLSFHFSRSHLPLHIMNSSLRRFFSRLSPLSLSFIFFFFFLFVLYVIVFFFFCCFSFLPMFSNSNSQCNSTVLKNKRVCFSVNAPFLCRMYGFLCINRQHFVLLQRSF